MILTAKIVNYDGTLITVEPNENINRILEIQCPVNVEIRLDDGRTISSEQRRKIFAIIRDISLWSGHEPEYLRQYLTWEFCGINDIAFFSLSNVDMTNAKEYITYLIDFCFYNSIPTKDTLLHQTDDIGKYLYQCLEHRKCAICNRYAEVHHVDRIGMGRDREEIVHVGLEAIALCREHHSEAHIKEKELFEYYHIYGIKLDKYLCERLKLRSKKKGD